MLSGPYTEAHRESTPAQMTCTLILDAQQPQAWVRRCGSPFAPQKVVCNRLKCFKHFLELFWSWVVRAIEDHGPKSFFWARHSKAPDSTGVGGVKGMA